MNFSKGYKVSNPQNIKESFSVENDHILINLSVEKYQKVMTELCKLLQEPLFFIIEVPCDELKEKELRKSNYDPLHKDVYYLDEIDNKAAETILENMGDMLINDGLSAFGFGCLEVRAEVMKGKYNTLTVFADDLKPYIDVLKSNEIEQVDSIVTAEDLFTRENPGICQKYVDKDNRDIFVHKDFFVKMGAYLDHTEEN